MQMQFIESYDGRFHQLVTSAMLSYEHAEDGGKKLCYPYFYRSYCALNPKPYLMSSQFAPLLDVKWPMNDKLFDDDEEDRNKFICRDFYIRIKDETQILRRPYDKHPKGIHEHF